MNSRGSSEIKERLAQQLGADPYKVLEIERNVSDKEVKRAYFQLVRKHPPEQDPEKFQEIRAAYDRLKTPKTRGLVDLFLLQFPPDLPNRRGPRYDLDVHVEDLIALAIDEIATPMKDEFRHVE
ncbi:MAG: DnaJ domain-containing protein [Chloroflexota bacterium]